MARNGDEEAILSNACVRGISRQGRAPPSPSALTHTLSLLMKSGGRSRCSRRAVFVMKCLIREEGAKRYTLGGHRAQVSLPLSAEQYQLSNTRRAWRLEAGGGGRATATLPPFIPRPAAHTQPSIAHTHPPPSPTATPKDEAEAARLQAILDAFPTTEAEDLVLRQSECGLDGGHARAARTPHAPHTYARDAHCDATPPPSPQSSPKRTGARPLSSSSGPPASAPCARPSTATVAGRRRRRGIASCEGKGRVGGGGGLSFAMAGAVVRRMCGAWVCVTQRQAAAMRRIERRGVRRGAEQEFEGGGWTVRRGACSGVCGVLIAAHGRGLMCLDHRRGESRV